MPSGAVRMVRTLVIVIDMGFLRFFLIMYYL